MTAPGAHLAPADTRGPSRRAAVATGLVLLALYAGTAATALLPWDAAEFTTAYAIFGVPHPPGTPLVVAWGRTTLALTEAWLQPPFAAALASATAAAVAGALLAWLLSRRGIGAAPATVMALVAACGATWWTAATEPEAYAMAMAVACALLVAAQEAGLASARGEQDAAWRWIAAAAYTAALAPAVHQLAWVALPAALWLAWPLGRPSGAQLMRCVAAVGLGVSSAAILWGRGLHGAPALMGDTRTAFGVWDVVTRAAYDGPGWLPRRTGLAWQALMPLQYVTEQYALRWPTALESATAQMLVFALVVLPLGALGLRWWWRTDRHMTWGLVLLCVAGLLGVAWHVNLALGPSLGWGIVPDGAAREVRERDTFFLVGLTAWGVLVGAGIVALTKRRSIALMLAAGWLLLARHGMQRDTDTRSARFTASLEQALEQLPPAAVVLAGTDWDTFGLWYTAEVQGRRRDLTVVVLGLVNHPEYRARLMAAAPGILPAVGASEGEVIRHVRAWAASHRRPTAAGPWTRLG